MSCCPPRNGAALDREHAETLAARIKALADPARLQLLSIIASGGEMCACDLTEPLELSQPTVSHHLKLLVAAGFLQREQRGKWAYFSVVPDQLRAIASSIEPG
jgi:ArsR family transcriptional regulator